MTWIQVNEDQVIRADSIQELISYSRIETVEKHSLWICQIKVNAKCLDNSITTIFETYEKTSVTNQRVDKEDFQRKCDSLKKEILKKILETIDDEHNLKSDIINLKKLLNAKEKPL
jgi:hypothetical protein